MKIMWLSLGAAFLCIGAANLSKAKKEEAAASEKSEADETTE